MLNQLYHNIVWGQKGNFVGVPTDCPQRDERLGWTGDAQVFSRTAAFNYDVAGFFTNWLGDAIADQRAIGSFPDVIPDVLTRGQPNATSSAGWGDAGVIIPWTMYLAYGDTRLLERQYPSMRRYVEYQHKVAGDALLWNSGWHYGDWLAFSTVRADYPGATTDKDLIATAFFAHSTDLLARSAQVLGKQDDARAYRDLFERIKAAWNREYVTTSGRLSSNTQTAYALALEFHLLPDAQRADAGQRLAANVRQMGHLTTGFLGTPYLTNSLSETGHLAESYQLLLNKKYPSWLYPITQGATTIWERWDGQKPDSSFQEISMNSFNHYAYGAIGDWMVRVVAGLDPRRSEAGLQAPRDSSAAWRQPHVGARGVDDAVRKRGVGMEARGRPASPRRPRSGEHARHGAAAGRDARAGHRVGARCAKRGRRDVGGAGRHCGRGRDRIWRLRVQLSCGDRLAERHPAGAMRLLRSPCGMPVSVSTLAPA